MILVFGATGFTGRMVVDDLVGRGLPVRIAGRSQERLEKLAQRHGGLEWVVADVKDPESVGRAADDAAVLVSTVGPYTWWGHIAVDAAIERGIPYIDITGEPPFIRKIFEEYGPRAEKAGAPLLTAMGYDYVPGNLAGALALEAAGDEARSIDIGYFLTGQNSRSLQSFSGGTLRSLRASGAESQFAFRGGKIVDERTGKRILNFDLGNRRATAVSIGSSEAFALPSLHPGLQEVNVGLGWFGAASRAVGAISAVTEKLDSIPLIRRLIQKTTGTGSDSLPETKGKDRPAGPSDEMRAQARTRVVAIARDAAGAELASVKLDGPNPYDLTGKVVGWAAEQAATGAISGAGAMGPVEAFGLEELRAACETIGLREV
jgi:short subunit dehydrogenase-like uncharacterized protein